MNPVHIVSFLAAASIACASTTAQRLLAVDTSGATAYEIDVATAARTSLGGLIPAATGTATIGELAYDEVSGKLYASSSSTDALYYIDMSDMSLHFVGYYNGVGTTTMIMHGLEWDSSTGTLYGMSTHDSGLYSIDTTTGFATYIGSTGLAAATSWGLALGYCPLNDTMYMTSTNTDSFYTIDRATGVATLIGTLDPVTNASTSIATMAYSLDTQTMYAIDNFFDKLYSIDLTTGLRTEIGGFGAANMIAMAYVPGDGRLSRQVHGCGTTTIQVTGNPSLGRTIEYTVGGYTAFPFVGYGVTNPALPFCGCTIGHEWAVAELGPVTHLTIPVSTGLVGAHVFAQGMDFGGVGGTCPTLQITLTDTIDMMIGL